MKRETSEAAGPREDSDSRADRTLCLWGRAVLFMALGAALTGAILLPFYRASADGAHASVEAIAGSTPLRLVRGAHHWASAMLLLGGGGYLVLGLYWGRFRGPHPLVWVSAVLLTVLFLAGQLTGHLLPWDAAAVRTAAIETGIAENMPLIGPVQARILRGGAAVGPATLRIWFGAHALLLPLLMAGLGAIFLLRTGGAQVETVRPLRMPAALAAILLIAAILAPAPLGPAATSADFRSFDALPEWYILPLHSLLTIAQRIHPSLAFLGTAVVPGLSISILLALPWVRLEPGRLPRILAVAGSAGLLILTALSAPDMAPVLGSATGTAERAATAQPRSASSIDPLEQDKGRKLFDAAGCASCHAVGGRGGAIGPPLDGEGTRHPDLDWQIRHLVSPAEAVRGSTMPSFRTLKEAEQRSIAAFLLSL